MKHTIRKTSSDLHVGYSDGGFSNNLRGENFTSEMNGRTLTLGINLESNLRTRNKSANSYADALEFLEKHDRLNLLQLNEEKVVSAIASAWKRNSANEMRLALSLGNNGSFSYEVKPQKIAGGIQLVVHGIVSLHESS